jgi:hypothetical protein
MLIPVVLIVAIAGCGRGNRSDQRVRLPVDVFSDTARVMRFGTADSILGTAPRATRSDAIPRATVWLARVRPAPASGIEPTLAPSEPAEPQGGSWPAPPPLEVDEGLKPPIPRGSARLGVPRDSGPGWVELDVRVDENGAVSDVAWAGGASDSAHIEAATAYAFAMRWFPALQGGRPVAVWCRQRIDFGR